MHECNPQWCFGVASSWDSACGSQTRDGETERECCCTKCWRANCYTRSPATRRHDHVYIHSLRCFFFNFIVRCPSVCRVYCVYICFTRARSHINNSGNQAHSNRTQNRQPQTRAAANTHSQTQHCTTPSSSVRWGRVFRLLHRNVRRQCKNALEHKTVCCRRTPALGWPRQYKSREANALCVRRLGAAAFAAERARERKIIQSHAIDAAFSSSHSQSSW